MKLRGTLWLLYALFIVYGATIPFHFSGDRGAIRQRVLNLSLDPLVSPDTGGQLSAPDVVQNTLLFVPFGALGMLGARTGGRLRRLAAVTLLGLGFSTAVEAAQLLTVDRTASVADVVANTVGTIAGAVALLSLQGPFEAGLRRLRDAGLADSTALPALATAAAAIAIAYWQPFDVTLDVSTTVAKVRALESDYWQFDGLRDEGTSIILSVFFATTLAGYLSVIGERRVAFKAALIGAGVVCALEASQFALGSRNPGLWDAAIGASGIVLGTMIWAASSRILWPGLWLGVIVAATAGAAALQMLSPFDWAATYRSMGWFPFLGYYAHTTFETLSHVIELVLLYVPLGFFVGGGQPSRWRAVATAAGLALVVAAPIEYLQGWVVGRYPDVTDIGVSLLGAALGAWAGRQGAPSPSGSAGR